MTAIACPFCQAAADSADEFCEACGRDLTPGTPAPVPTPVGVPSTVAAAGGLPADGAVGLEGAGEGEGFTEAPTHLLLPPGAPPESEPVVPPQLCSCGGAIDDDGWCTVCGSRATNGREHLTDQPAPNVAGVCDRGRRHPRNEDAMALSAGPDRIVLVVCDGVTTATDSDVASMAAAVAARDLLAAAEPAASSSPAKIVDHWTHQLAVATTAANDAAAATAAAVGSVENPPSSTYVAAVVDGDVIIAGWVGDSRVYWLTDQGAALQLSVDDSWATEQIAAGVSREVAEADSRAHSITRWLGVDSPELVPTSSTTTVTEPGWLLACSDGLWNYCSGAKDLARLVAAQVVDTGEEPLALAEGLVAWANEQGGHDNITAAVARLRPKGLPDIPPPTEAETRSP